MYYHLHHRTDSTDWPTNTRVFIKLISGCNALSNSWGDDWRYFAHFLWSSVSVNRLLLKEFTPISLWTFLYVFRNVFSYVVQCSLSLASPRPCHSTIFLPSLLPHSTSITIPVGSPVTQNPCNDTLNFAVGNKAFAFKLSFPFEPL